MLPVSVVIIVRNEAGNIRECIQTAAGISTDIIVVDSGSTDNTIKLACEAGARTVQTEWRNYAASRNIGATLALNDWIFALDADERITQVMAQDILSLPSDISSHFVFGFRRENYFINKKIRFGDWGHDVVYRLYNRNKTSWKNIPVHETLQFAGLSKHIGKGRLLHYTVTDIEVYSLKMMRYALLSSQKRIRQHQNISLLKKWGSPAFNFITGYFIRLGFLDGKAGLIIAWHVAWYSWMKYNYDWEKETAPYKFQTAHK